MSAIPKPQEENKMTPDVIAAHGLKPEEYARILEILGREPNLVELGIFGAMWSEHCSYKSTRIHLKKLPTTAPWVICGPGENAGVIDIGDGQAAIFKMESHNHPSYIEPYQGAATGVGGILRDVFTMGARPVANLNALRFGAIDHPKTSHLVSGVVSGIGGYGNCVGIPTVGGECTFHPAYNGNILVNAMTVGIADADKIFYARATGIGNSVVYVGAKTGRDGIKGAVMASAEFDDQTESKRPTVQVGDPFTEKLLIEACMELMQQDAILAIQDMGAAGMTSSSIEMAGRGGMGLELDLDRVPKREFGMTAYEIMLSESQERMLMIVRPDKEEQARMVFDKWGLDFAVIGKLNDSGLLTLKREGKIVGTLPIAPFSDQAPVYDRPHVATPAREKIGFDAIKNKQEILTTLKQLLATPDLCSKRWIWEQYDHMVMNDTVICPGGDASVVRVHNTKKALAVTSDCTPRYCFADPVEGGKQAVAESYRNISATGALPLAITNCLNFGSPERPEIMGQLVGAIEGMVEACKTLDYPVVSGNVSLYNETSGQAILPTPNIGGVGLLKDVTKLATIPFKAEGEVIYLIGETKGHLGASIYLREIEKSEKGTPPAVDLAAEKKHATFVRELVEQGAVKTCHDVADGGLLVAIAEMAMASNIGAALEEQNALPAAAFWFGEDQARYVVAVEKSVAVKLEDQAKKSGIPLTKLGATGGDAIAVGQNKIVVRDLKTAHEATMPKFFG